MSNETYDPARFSQQESSKGTVKYDIDYLQISAGNSKDTLYCYNSYNRIIHLVVWEYDSSQLAIVEYKGANDPLLIMKIIVRQVRQLENTKSH